MLLVSVMYAATLGGTATLIGTPANLVLKGILEKRFEGRSGLTFTSYMVVALPGMVANILLAWIYLQLAFLGLPSFKKSVRTPQSDHLREVIR
jgi:sodium-dependent dicarboxylate transporter 2/3/5